MLLFLFGACTPAAPPAPAAVAVGGIDAPADAPREDLSDAFNLDTGAPPDDDAVVHFLAVGDAGEGNANQYALGAQMATFCASHPCDFVLYLGDNFYFDGISSIDDSQFQTKFELPFADVDIPFYATLGNHDYGGNGSGSEFWKADYQIEYTDHSEKWRMPAEYYDFTAGPGHFWSLDTNAIYWGFWDDVQPWLDASRDASTSPWKIAYGHHPYVSNGPHGNAGSYDNSEDAPISSGEQVKRVFDESVCGKIDVYLSGHDHSMQWLEPTCGTEFIVSGAGSHTTSADDGENPTYFASTAIGFLWVELTATTFHGEFRDSTGRLLFARDVVKE